MANRNLGSVLTLANATASATGGDIDNWAGLGAIIVVDITSITGTAPTATFTVEGKDDASGKYYTILATTALAAVATTVLRVHPSLTAAANAIAKDMMPRTFRVRCTTGGTVTDLDATVGVILTG